MTSAWKSAIAHVIAVLKEDPIKVDYDNTKKPENFEEDSGLVSLLLKNR